MCQYVEISLKVNLKEITSIFKDITPACFKSHKHRDIVELNIIFVNWSMNDKLTKNHPDTMRFFFFLIYLLFCLSYKKLSNDTLLTKITAHIHIIQLHYQQYINSTKKT